MWTAAFDRVTFARLHGNLAKAEARSTEAFTLGSAGHQPDALSFYANQLSAIRWEHV